MTALIRHSRVEFYRQMDPIAISGLGEEEKKRKNVFESVQKFLIWKS